MNSKLKWLQFCCKLSITPPSPQNLKIGKYPPKILKKSLKLRPLGWTLTGSAKGQFDWLFKIAGGYLSISKFQGGIWQILKFRRGNFCVGTEHVSRRIDLLMCELYKREESVISRRREKHMKISNVMSLNCEKRHFTLSCKNRWLLGWGHN
jgi:hypothetical protein